MAPAIFPKSLLRVAIATLFAIPAAMAQLAPSAAEIQMQKALQQIEKLATQVAAQEARIQELEAERGNLQTAGRELAASNLTAGEAVAVPAGMQGVAALVDPVTVPQPEPGTEADPHDHMINLPGGGPALKIRGFFDFNYGMGSVANPLQFPLGAPAHDTFQAGEFDLFISSKISDHFSFIGEMVFGADQTNLFSIDIERYELTYKASRYFEISAGRYHSAIGYYNTAYHHGTWFGTATGRPFMYYYEDSGGLLPVHNVGLTSTGLVPGTDKLGLHWVAEVGNGRASSSSAVEPVQNFLSDRNHKAVNFALYVKPEWLEGLQAGGSFYDDKLFPDGVTPVSQHIGSLYAVYFRSGWEFLNEGVLLSNHSGFNGRTYHSPMMYTQVSHRFGAYVPYFRFQYVNAPAGDPVNVFAGRYEGPSEGIRYNISDYAALKLQYNRIYGLIGNTKPANGLDANVSFTF